MDSLLMLASGGGADFISAVKKNPFFIVCNMCVSAVVITIVIDRITFQMSRYRVNSKEFFAQIKKLVDNGNVARAIKL